MALPPTAVEAPPMAAPGAAPDMPMAEGEGGGWEVCCTILKHAATGEFKLISGDEPEAEEGADMGAAEGQVFASGPELLRGVMAEIESDKGAEAAFGRGYRGEPEDKAAEGPPMLG